MSGYVLVLFLFPCWLAALVVAIAARQGQGWSANGFETESLFNTLCIVGPVLCGYATWGRLLMPLFGVTGIAMALLGRTSGMRQAGLDLLIGTVMAVTLIMLLALWSSG
jgi:hypothetical protein